MLKNCNPVITKFLFLVLACSPGWKLYQTYCYQFFTTKKNWNDAQIHCESRSSNLASVLSSGELAFLNNNVIDKVDTTTWIGGKKSNGWKWEDGSKYYFTAWISSSEPGLNDNRICIIHSKWYGREETSEYYFVCKKKSYA